MAAEKLAASGVVGIQACGEFDELGMPVELRLTFDEYGPISALLEWTEEHSTVVWTNRPGFDAIRVWRDGRLLDSFPATDGSYLDSGPITTARVDWQVEFLNQDGSTVCFLEAPVEFPSALFMRMDVTGDGKVTIADVIETLVGLFPRRPFLCPDAADADDDGRITLSDAILLLLHLFADEARRPSGQLPPPGVCGPDASADMLEDCLYISCRESLVDPHISPGGFPDGHIVVDVTEGEGWFRTKIWVTPIMEGDIEVSLTIPEGITLLNNDLSWTLTIPEDYTIESAITELVLDDRTIYYQGSSSGTPGEVVARGFTYLGVGFKGFDPLYFGPRVNEVREGSIVERFDAEGNLIERFHVIPARQN